MNSPQETEAAIPAAAVVLPFQAASLALADSPVTRATGVEDGVQAMRCLEHPSVTRAPGGFTTPTPVVEVQLVRLADKRVRYRTADVVDAIISRCKIPGKPGEAGIGILHNSRGARWSRDGATIVRDREFTRRIETLPLPRG